jgi:autotransporter-associated beta strand protein
MNRQQKLKLLGGVLLAAFAGVCVQGAQIIGDDYNVTGTGSGFALGSGVNSGINPPTTRLTGSAAAGLRYIKAFGAKADTAHTITGNKLQIARIATDSSTLSLSPGSGTYDFATPLNILAATPAVPAVYDITINIASGGGSSAGNQRCSFALSSTAGTAGTWDFGIQIYRAASSDTNYTLQKRISAGASGSAAINLPITLVGTTNAEVPFLIRVTDAGAESSTFNSRIQVSTNAGASWVYDSSTDPDLPSGFHFPSTSRFIYWDVAGGAGPITFDNFSLNSISGPTTAPRTWTGAGANNNWSTSGNWDTTAPGSGDMLIFNGTTRQINTNDISGLTVPWVTFNNGGFSLYGNPLTLSSSITNLAGNNAFGEDLAWSSIGAKSWSIASGSELLLSNSTSVEVNGDHSLYGGGALRVKGTMSIGQTTTATPAFVVNEGQHIVDGGTFTSRGGYRIGSQATGTGATTIITNGASFNLIVAGANLRVGDNSNSVTSRLIIDHSTLTMAGGSIGIPYAAGSTGDVSQVGGLVAGASLNFNQNGAGQGTYTVQNGALEVVQIKKTTSGSRSFINFDNATLRAAPGASNAFFSGLNTAEIRSGGLVIDAQSDISIAQVLSGAGSLTKSNFATVTLTGANTYTGNTVVQSGKLTLPTVQTNSTTVQVVDAAELGVVESKLGSTLTVNGLNFTGSSFGTLSFDLGSFGTPTAPLMKVTNLSVSGPVTINVGNGFQLTPGQIVLVDYDGVIGGGFQFTLGSLPPGVAATLVNNTANSSIDLNITAVPGFIWTGATSGDWDYSTQNWIDQQTGLPATYADGFPVTFPDVAANGNLNLVAFPSPTAIIVSNNALPYVWSGGAITTPLLKKIGTGSLTRMGGEADLITGIELDAGVYIFSNLFDATFATVLTDVGTAGTFVKRGSGLLTISSTNSTYDGAMVIQDGIVKLGNDRGLGSTVGGTTITNGGTLDLNNFAPGAEPLVVSGAGVNGQGAIIDSTTGGGVAANLRDVTLAGDAVFGAPNGGRWDLRVRSSTGPGPGLRGNGFKLTKVGSGTVSIASQRNLDASTPYWQMNLGDILVSEGSLAFAEAIGLGNPSASLTISPGAMLQLYDLGVTNPILRNITMTDARLNCGGTSTDTNIVNGGIQITGSNVFYADQGSLTINGVISGSGSITIGANNPGTLVFNGINTYTGDTVVTNGTLSGSGVIAGNLFVNGGTNAPGWGGLGTLTVNGNVTLASATTMKLNRSQSPNSDRLVVGGTLAEGGVLNVVIAPGAPAPQGGDVYQLFNKGGSGAFSAISLPTLSSGLSWNTTNLTVNGTISVLGSSSQPTFSGVHVEGGNLVFSGTGGVEGSFYTVLSSTNVAAPVSIWIPVSTNVFGPGGSFSYTNAINPAATATFFLLRMP